MPIDCLSPHILFPHSKFVTKNILQLPCGGGGSTTSSTSGVGGGTPSTLCVSLVASVLNL